MRRWLGVFTMGSAHDLCPGRRSERHGSKTRHYRAGSRSRVRSSGLGAIACLLIATCRKFTVLLANAGVDASNLRILLSFLLGVQLSLQSREAIEEQLGNVGQSDSVAACDTFAGVGR